VIAIAWNPSPMKRRARHFDGRTRMSWSPRTLWFGLRAILASAVLVAASAAQQEAADRRRMVDEIDAMLASAAGKLGVAKLSPQVRAAMIKVPRHEFVPLAHRSTAYSNTPLPIGRGQTISQPPIAAKRLEPPTSAFFTLALNSCPTPPARRRQIRSPCDKRDHLLAGSCPTLVNSMASSPTSALRLGPPAQICRQ
jgi:hypothetical protein